MRPRSTFITLASWASLFALPILACNFGRSTPTPRPTVAPVAYTCETEPAPTPEDIAYASGYTGDIFEFNGWKKTILLHDTYVEVIWNNDEEGALAYVRYLVFGCAYTPANWEADFSEQALQTGLFSDYDNLLQQANCTTDETTLFEMTADYAGEPYRLRYWVVQESDTRLLTMLLVFHNPSARLLPRYAEAVFPDFSACP